MPFPSPFGVLSVAEGGGALTPPSLQAGLTLASTAPSLAFQIVNNDATSPTVVELAFTHSALEAEEWDDGTADSPSFALDPGSTRTVNFVRGSGAPVYGDPDVTETITATLADATTLTQTVTVEGLGMVHAYVASISAPTIEFRMDTLAGALLYNAGSIGSAMDSTLTGLVPAPSTTYPGFTGYMDFGAASDYIYSATHQYEYTNRSTDRTWIMAWTPGSGGLGGDYMTVGTGGYNTSAMGWMVAVPASNYMKMLYFNNNTTVLLAASQAGVTHSSAGTPQDLALTAGKVCLLSYTFDLAALTGTIRWKQKGNPSGHTLYSAANTAQSSTGPVALYTLNHPSVGAFPFFSHYWAVIDSVITAAQFDDMTDMMGM